MTKRYQMARALKRVEQLLEDLGIGPLRLLYAEVDEATARGAFTEYERKLFRIRPGEEIVTVTGQDGLLYVLQVTGDSVLTAVTEVMELLANKF